MSELIIFASLVILLCLPIAILAATLIFRASFLKKIGIGISIIAAYAAVIGFTIAKIGLIHITWGASSAIVLMVVVVLYLRKDVHVLQLIRDDIEKMSKLDLRISFTEANLRRKDEMGGIVSSMQVMTERLNGIVNAIQNNSNELNSASMQLSAVSQEISENANEQAISAEEVAASMEEMQVTIDSNTKQAEKTSEITANSANEMKQSNKVILQSINSTLEISQRVQLISNIATKTDMLSINASIEAARAGEFGKGFGVVAHEIRKLADTTKDASERITTLSESGQQISEEAGKKLEQIIAEILKSAAHVNNIVTASREQQISVGSIKDAVFKLSEITQQNSAASEEMQATASDLSERARQLDALVSGFQTNKQSQ